jgi:hypothetical protein
MKNCYRVRGEFTHIPKEERLRYLQAVLAISAQAQYKKRYEALLEIHRKYFRTPIHKAPNFLPWHRWFLLEYENLLREVIIASEFFLRNWSFVVFESMIGPIWNVPYLTTRRGGDRGEFRTDRITL